MSFRRTCVYLVCAALVLVASAVALSACGGSDELSVFNSPTPSSSPVQVTPAAPASPTAPAVSASPSPSGNPTTQASPSSKAPNRSATPTPTSPTEPPSETPQSTPAPGPTMAGGSDLAAIRGAMSGYWTAYNAYDAEKALSYLEDNYRTSVEKTVRSEIGKIKTFKVKLGVTEKNAPALAGADKATMFVNMTTPTGAKVIMMSFARVGGVWKITSVQEV